MQLRCLLGFHSGNLPFLLLYEATLLRNRLPTFREKERVPFSKGQNVEDDSSVKDITTTFHQKIREIIT
jgi:hypothetical protein